MNNNKIDMDTRKKLETFIDKTIIRSNSFCYIEEVFDKNEIAKNFLNKARKELDKFYTISEARVFSNAICKMADDIESIKKETSVSDIESLSVKIRELEDENKLLKSSLESIYNLSKIINGGNNE